MSAAAAAKPLAPDERHERGLPMLTPDATADLPPTPDPSCSETERQLLLAEAQRVIADLTSPRGAPHPRTAWEAMRDRCSALEAPLPGADPIAARWRTIAERGPWLTDPPPSREWLLRRLSDDGASHGVIGAGIVALFVAPGGRGKTMALTQLAISIATGRPWLGTMDVARAGHVVLALAEEDDDEVRRRLYYVARALELSDHELRQCAERITPLALRSELVPLVRRGEGGEILASEHHASLVRALDSRDHSLVILDPLARFAPGVESDNEQATAAITLIERLSTTRGNPTVIVAHHTAKWSQREGNSAEAPGGRGVTGLRDGVRLEMKLTGTTDRDLTLAISKSNYATTGEPIELVRDRMTGLLRPPSSLEIDMRRVQESSADRERTAALRAAVLAAVQATHGIGTTDLRAACRGHRADAVSSMAAELCDDGAIEDRGTERRHRYYPAGAGAEEGFQDA